MVAELAEQAKEEASRRPCSGTGVHAGDHPCRKLGKMIAVELKETASQKRIRSRPNATF